jgi:adenylate kinase family enzyme
MADKDRDLKKLLGNAKITFILGGPASGKGTQCEKLVEEFGYTHISTGDLMRAEIAKGTKEGDRIRKIVADGGLVPFETTVQLLINALIATPSKNYLIDGFPRAVDQAQYFEQNVMETQQVLFYDVPQELMIERCMKRAETSGRDDDNAETIKKRIQQFFDQSMPVVDYYKRFSKVRKIDATGGISDVYAASKDAVLPQTMFVLGPKGAGKSTISNNLSDRTNAAFLNFHAFKAGNGLADAGEEEVVLKLIQTLAEEPKPRVVLENFPENVF